MDKTFDKHWILRICLILTLAIIAVYGQVRSHEFVNYDDEIYITNNWRIKSGINDDSLSWAFTSGYAGNWHPLTWLSHMLDWQLFGPNPTGHHFVNLFLHIANTLLLFIIFAQMTAAIWPSAFIAAAFALHPLHVESVAWAAERKDVLSTLFWMLTMFAYVRYIKIKSKNWYLLAMAFFALGLMAKPMLVTLPFILLLLDYWPLQRFQIGQTPKLSTDKNSDRQSLQKLIIEKVPFLLLAVSSCIVTFIVQQKAGAVASTEKLDITVRVANAVTSYGTYITKMIWPTRLAMFYPHPGSNISMAKAAISAAILIALSIYIIRLAKTHKYLLVGWLWYLGTLIPVIGIVQVGNQALADRYSYIPLTGLFIIIAWGALDIFSKFNYKKNILAALAAIVLIASTICTYIQTSYWQSSITLFEHALEVTENNYIAHFCISAPLHDMDRSEEANAHTAESLRINPNYIEALNGMGVGLIGEDKYEQAITYLARSIQLNPTRPESYVNMGISLLELGRIDEAIANYKKALEIEKNIPVIYDNLGFALALKGNFEQAVICFNKAIALDPAFVGAHKNLGATFAQMGNLDKALQHYSTALQLNPNFPEAHNGLSMVFLRLGNIEKAIEHLEKTLQLNPYFVDGHSNLGVLLVQVGQIERAIPHYIQALQINPKFATAYYNLGYALSLQGKTTDAIPYYKKALELEPNMPRALNDLAWLLATNNNPAIRNPKEAIQLAKKSCELTNNQQPANLVILAAAYAADSNFKDAIATAQKALELAKLSNKKDLINKLQTHLELYKAGKPYITP